VLGLSLWSHYWCKQSFRRFISCNSCLPPGPYGGNVFNPRSWGGGSVEITNQITLEVTRVVLAIGVFAIGVELPKAYMLRHWKSIFFLIVPVMTYVRLPLTIPRCEWIYSPSLLVSGLVCICSSHIRSHAKIKLPIVVGSGRLSYSYRPYSCSSRCRW
jgi:hypothetical protein